ncbi:MAG: FtsX-like permease family protein [Actinomycetota bacterium]|nr:FtsX-like permease family protein [Actinomycetota bacterium]
MTRFALKALLGRKLRTVLSAFAIVLGVATVSGTYVLTDSIDKAFGSIFTESRNGSDAVISGKAAFDIGDGTGVTAPALDESLLQKVRALPDVRLADGSVNGEAQLIGKDGKAIVYGGAPNLGFSIAKGDSPFNPLTLVEGSWPKQDEVVIDKSTAGKEHLSIGQIVGVQAVGPVQKLRVSGVVKFGSVSTIGGATLAGFDLPTAQKLFAKPGKLDEIAIASEPNVATNQLLQQIRGILPADTQVRTGQGQAQEDSKETNSFISFLQKFLLGFGGVALFVGSFVIANSLSITIAQRTRELATLRTLGASRRQLLRSIIIEALAIGILAAVIGLFAGLALAKGLFALFDTVGFTLPNNGLTFETRTVVVSLAVGIIVTLLASLRPALRATRVPPIAAVREGATLPESRYARFRLPVSALLMVLGFGGLLWGLFAPELGTSGILLFMLGGALLVFFGIALFTVRLVTPLAGALGWPATRIGGTAGTLARENAQRNPQRTASTASALMIGLALVTLVSMLAAGIITSFKSSVVKIWKNADYAITAQNNFSPIPVAAGEAVAKTPGVIAIGNVRAGEARAFNKTSFVTAVNPASSQMFQLDWNQGSGSLLADLGADGAFVEKGYAKDHHLRVGSPIPLTFATGARKTFVLRGIFDPPTGGSPFGSVTISAATFDRFVAHPQNLYSFVLMKGGQTDANKAALDQTLKAFPNAKAATRQKFIDNQISGLSSVLNILYVLLALSVIVSLFGIVNTLVLTVFERTREIGMLRAIGMTRRQVRRMIRHESVITALIGAVIGIALGIVLAALLIARVDFIVLSIPVGQLIIFGIAAIIVGIIAAIFPARRAARLNVLEALQYE